MLDGLDRWEARLTRWLQAEWYDTRVEAQELFGLARPPQTPMILAVRARCYDERRSAAQTICRYAENVTPLKHANYIVARADADIRYLPGVVGAWQARLVCEPGVGNMPFPRAMRRCDAPTQPYHLQQIGVPKAHETTEGEGIDVGVVDTGVDASHSELSGKVVAGYDFTRDKEDCEDDNGHGTHVCGLIAGTTVGAAPAASLHVAKVLDKSGVGNEATIALGFDWLIDQGVYLINASLGSRQSSPLEQELMDSCADNGIQVCAAAGNDGYGKSYPAAYEGVLSVAAVDKLNKHAYFSNIDETVDISAPGVDIISCVPGGYAEYSGTSMATPLAVGCGALALAAGCDDVQERLVETAQALGPPEEYGAGLVRADAAVAAMVHKVFNRKRAGLRHGIRR